MTNLHQIPHSVFENTNCSVLLTDRDKSEWKFLFQEIKNIPDAFSDNQNYDFSAVDETEWQKVTVPSSLVMQGFDIENNTEYYYKRTVRIPNDMRICRLFLHFEGVYSNARVWIDNRFIGSHIGGFTPWDLEIVQYVEKSEFELVVGVADIEGDKKSPWNPTGEYQSNSAWASYYAHHNIGGILRDITLFCLPQKAIYQTHIDTTVSGSDAAVKVMVRLSENCKGLALKAQLLDGDSVKAETITEVGSAQLELSLVIRGAKLWDAEHPNLYALKLSLIDESNNAIQENNTKFGFREITYGGKNGTDKNKIYVNGKEIKLRGVCRHDVSRLYGRSVPKDELYHEIKTYKEHNINHIRTSHYPVSDYMLSVCDELGMYVEQENAACFKGANGYEVFSKPEDFLRSFAEMVEFSRNHPSVVIWSIANESGFEKSSGFRNCYDFIKKTDRTRPAIFSYPDTVRSLPLPYDIYSKHYAKVKSDLGRKNMPILHDEFAHVPCYNLEDLTTDNACRVFWGESIKRGWDKIFDSDGALGCDIWAAVDDVFYLPQKDMEKHQNHLKGDCAGYGEWGCVFDCFKRLKPEAYLTKKAFSPIHIIDSELYGDELRFKIQNRFDHTNLNEGTVTVLDGNGNELYSGRIKESVEPHEIGTVRIAPIPVRKNRMVRFFFGETETESIVLSPKQETITLKPSNLFVDYEKRGIIIGTKANKIARINGMCLQTGTYKVEQKTAKLKKVGAKKYRADFGFGKGFILSVTEQNGKLKLGIRPNALSSFLPIGKIQIDIELFEKTDSVSWQRESLYSVYPDGHVARNSGTAPREGKVRRYEDPDVSDVKWEEDMTAFSYYPKTAKENAAASNDFKTTRLNIREYCVHFSSGTKLLVETDSKQINAYADSFDGKLKISKGNYMPSIAWGNYWGEKRRLSRKNSFSFTVVVSETEE